MLPLPTRLTQARILIVDDVAFNRKVILAALRKAGFTQFQQAGNGLEAVAMTHRWRPDLVLLDLDMPHLDGFGYCAHVRHQKDIPPMPIIVQTGLDEREAKWRALGSGADDFVTKPLDPIELALRARNHLERYFMLRDLQDMQGYLSMELVQAQNLLSQIHQGNLSGPVMKHMNRHVEALSLMLLIPPFVGYEQPAQTYQA